MFWGYNVKLGPGVKKWGGVTIKGKRFPRGWAPLLLPSAMESATSPPGGMGTTNGTIWGKGLNHLGPSSCLSNKEGTNTMELGTTISIKWEWECWEGTHRTRIIWVQSLGFPCSHWNNNEQCHGECSSFWAWARLRHLEWQLGRKVW